MALARRAENNCDYKIYKTLEIGVKYGIIILPIIKGEDEYGKICMQRMRIRI